ncbi:MAG TPA: hypothetical protein VMM12_17335 [Longimicrobiales bacterium]|nr:hypothetical protein [Longimicrobiales bacterium]
MKPVRPGPAAPRRIGPVALTLALLACGGGDGDAPPADAAPDDTAPATSPHAVPDGEPGPWAMPPVEGQGSGQYRGVAILRGVRTGRHDAFDRIVFEFAGHLPPYAVRYVESPAACGSGDAVDPGGAAALEVDLRPAAAHDGDGRATIHERTFRPGLPALRAARITCDFEAVVTWVLGVDRRTPVRVLELSSPPRLVLDLRHR